jgi:pimeloyl-ACP methyl ester carboxylesterase
MNLVVTLGGAESSNLDTARMEWSHTLNGTNGPTHIHIGGKQDSMDVLLIHGLLFGLKTWDRTLKAFPIDQYKTVRYDLIGVGGSAKPNIQYRAEPFLCQLEEVWQFAEIDSPAIIVASSMGAIIAAMKTVEAAAEVSALVLIAPAGFQPRPPWRFHLVTKPIIAQTTIYLLSRSERLLRYFCSDLLTPEQQEKFIPELQQRYQNPAARKILIQTLRDFPLYNMAWLYEELSSTQVPILVIWGSDDWVVRYPGPETIKQHLPNAQIVLIEGGHHVLQCNQAEIINKRITEFLTNLN